jgi:hypothetical protein
MGTYDSIDFLVPGGLSSFSAALTGRWSEEESARSINWVLRMPLLGLSVTKKDDLDDLTLLPWGDISTTLVSMNKCLLTYSIYFNL